MNTVFFYHSSGAVVTGATSKSKEELARTIKDILLNSDGVIGFLRFNYEGDVLIAPYSFIQKCAIKIE